LAHGTAPFDLCPTIQVLIVTVVEIDVCNSLAEIVAAEVVGVHVYVGVLHGVVVAGVASVAIVAVNVVAIGRRPRMAIVAITSGGATLP